MTIMGSHNHITDRIEELQVELIHGARAFEQLADEWNGLAGRSMTDTPFQQLSYQASWWRNLGPGNLVTISMRDEAADLVAIGSFYVHNETVYFNGCVEETDYLDLIAPAEWAGRAWAAAFAALHDPAFPHWQRLELCNIPAASPTRDILPQLTAQLGYDFATNVHEVCPIITLPGSFEEYLSQLDKKQRHEVRRKLRRAEAVGVEIVTIGPEDDLDQAIDTFLALLEQSTAEKKEWLNAERRAMFREIAAASLAAGHLQLMFLMTKDQAAAALFNFDYRGRIWVYNSGLDTTRFGHLSPGVVLTARAIEQAVGSGRTYFDFLRGNEVYKYRFGAKDTTVHRIIITRH
jgi:CelD/BcsL family acetyltransferase involved in cellulose biosynthesis